MLWRFCTPKNRTKMLSGYDLALKKPPAIATSKLGPIRYYEPFGGHWEKMQQLNKMSVVELFSLVLTLLHP